MRKCFVTLSLSISLSSPAPSYSVWLLTIIDSNGKTAGITLPSADGQEAVIRKAYAKACIGFSQTAYVECHGTGTKVGDVIEGKFKARSARAGRKFPFFVFQCIC